jgi:hypothetical protein
MGFYNAILPAVVLPIANDFALTTGEHSMYAFGTLPSPEFCPSLPEPLWCGEQDISPPTPLLKSRESIE